MLLEQEPRPLLQTLQPQHLAPLPILGHTRKPFLYHHQQQLLLAEQPSSSRQAAALQQPETVSMGPRPSIGPLPGFTPLPVPYIQQNRGSDYLLAQQLQAAEHGDDDEGLPDAGRQELSTLYASSSQWKSVVDPAMHHESVMNAEAAAVQARGEAQQGVVRESPGGFQRTGTGHWQESVRASINSIPASVNSAHVLADRLHTSIDSAHQGRGSKRQATAYETAATLEANSSSSRQVGSQLPHVAVGTRQANDVDSQMEASSDGLVSMRRRLMSVETEIDRSRTDVDVLHQLIATGHGPVGEAQLGSARRPAVPGGSVQAPPLSSLGVPWGGRIMHDQGRAVEWQPHVDGQLLSRHPADFPARTLQPSQAGTSIDQGPSRWDPSQQHPSNELGSVLSEGIVHASSNPVQAYGQGEHDTNSTSLQIVGGNADGSSWDPQQAIRQRYVARDRDGSDLTWVRRFPDAAWRSITPATDADPVAPDPDTVQTTTVRVVNMRLSKSSCVCPSQHACDQINMRVTKSTCVCSHLVEIPRSSNLAIVVLLMLHRPMDFTSHELLCYMHCFAHQHCGSLESFHFLPWASKSELLILQV